MRRGILAPVLMAALAGIAFPGYAVLIQTAAAPSDRHATGYVNDSKDQGKDAPVSVIVNANTGAVEDVVKH